MTTPNLSSSWIPLNLLRNRFIANVDALAGRYPRLAESLRRFEPSENFHIRPDADRVVLGSGAPPDIRPEPSSIPPAMAVQLTRQLFPKGYCEQPLLIAGEDLGWLLNSVYSVRCDTPTAVGHRPPLFVLIRQMQRLWIMLHLHDWPKMLADSRLRLYVGADALDQFRAGLLNDHFCPWPRISLNLDAALWPAELSFQQMIGDVHLQRVRQTDELRPVLQGVNDAFDPERFVAKYRGGEPLNILGITSRFTTFLQHSMRDWLAAFEKLGHRTRLLIETEDHHAPSEIGVASICAEFKPDLIVGIDHFRRAFGVALPAIPVIMWVQDMLPHLLSAEAGAAQGPRDFCLGFGRLQLSRRFGYPAQRFLSANIGVNTERFAPGQLTDAQMRQFGCDVSYVSHASKTADELVREQIEQMKSPPATRLFNDMHQRIVAHYEGGGPALDEPVVKRMLADSMIAVHCTVQPHTHAQTLGFFYHTVNNAVFRHQTLRWLSELGVDLRLYGRGWEKHPHLAKHACGVADNQTQLRLIYQASKINLQVVASGAVHQRLLDGLACGGFFLIRHSIGDEVGRYFLRLWDWCKRNGVASQSQLSGRADSEARSLVDSINKIMGYDMSGAELNLFDLLETHADAHFMHSATSIWPQYDDISFRSRAELSDRLKQFLADERARHRIAFEMREKVVEKASYERITQRMLEMICTNFTQPPAMLKAAA